MTEPKIAQRSPYQVEVVEGKNYAWCACGLSKNQPFCDGAHSGTGLSPVVWKAQETKTIYLCGCKHSKKAQFCDGTHSSL
ncbi:MAG: CDGSH iron-sulfur domain-containing protein [Rickettsiales bacterium]|jgi:CDGSH-type Zn-finger protein